MIYLHVSFGQCYITHCPVIMMYGFDLLTLLKAYVCLLNIFLKLVGLSRGFSQRRWGIDSTSCFLGHLADLSSQIMFLDPLSPLDYWVWPSLPEPLSTWLFLSPPVFLRSYLHTLGFLGYLAYSVFWVIILSCSIYVVDIV